MRNLFSAHLARLWRSGWFWTGAVVMAWFAWRCVSSAHTMADYGEPVSIWSDALSFLPPLLVALPVFAAVFLNGDYYYGTIRNKLTAGHRRSAVYLADLGLIAGVGLVYTGVYQGILLGFGLPLVGTGERFGMPGWGEIAPKLAASLAVILAISAMSVFLARLMTHRAVPLAALGLALALIFAARTADQMLLTPAEVPSYDEIVPIMDESGRTVKGYRKDGVDYTMEDCPTEPNPEYMGEPLHAALAFAQNFSPAGQAYQLVSDTVSGPVSAPALPPGTLAAFALGFTAAATGLGLILFQRKDLK